MWFKAPTDVPRSPATLKLARLIKVSRWEAVGLLYDLWCWGFSYADPSGELHGMQAEDIAAALDISAAKRARCIDSLVECGYLNLSEGVYYIADWPEIGGQISERREKDKKRKREERSARNPQDVHRTSAGRPADRSRTQSGDPRA